MGSTLVADYHKSFKKKKNYHKKGHKLKNTNRESNPYPVYPLKKAKACDVYEADRWANTSQ